MRQPTLDEAVTHMKNTITKAQKRANIAYWRRKYGDGFADQVAQTYIAGLKGKKA